MIILLLLFLAVLGNSEKALLPLKEECKENEVGVREQICYEEEERECSLCHTMYIKECTIKMEETNKPVKMRNCITVQGDTNCKEGYRRSCRTLYEAECGTQWQYKDIEEDRPVCGVEMVGKCKHSNQKDANSSRGCVEIPVMRCRIEKRMVRKRMPRTSCRRIPRQFCRKTKCKQKNKKCFYKIHMVTELLPVETCSYSPKKICQETDDSSKSCRTVKRKVCKPVSNKSNTLNKICKDKNTVDTGHNEHSIIGAEGSVQNNIETERRVKTKKSAEEHVQYNMDVGKHVLNLIGAKIKAPIMIKSDESDKI